MFEKEMAARPEAPATTSEIKRTDDNAAGTKLERILALFVGLASLNRFEAERHHDHCLHSTVSFLQNDCLLEIDRVRESVPCVHGTKRTSVCRYWLRRTPENLERARAVLAHMRRKR